MRWRTIAVVLTVLTLPAPGSQPIAASHPPARARHGMVASTSEIASKAGLQVLRTGGNAVDAAVAVGLALAVTHPSAGNIGGGGFMLIRMADGRTSVIDYREKAPRRAHRDMYLDRSGEIIPRASTEGAQASGVPGTVAGFQMALEKFGTRSFARLALPAERLARLGFPVSYRLAESLKSSRQLLARFESARRIFLRGGKYFEEGDVLRQPDLAATFRRLIRRGPREFYQGETARRIAQSMASQGGLITIEDLRDYRPVERAVLRTSYRDYEVLSIPPPSSGGIVLFQMLHMLETYELEKLGHNSADYVHLLVEVMRRAFADRAQFLGDPDFSPIPVRGLISRAYADQLRKTIDPVRATPSSEIGHGNPSPFESDETTHYTVVDAAGNAVSNTYTLNGGYGSGVVITGTGILMNNEMDDFSSKPGAPNMFGLIQGQANAIAAGKRPLSATTPAIVVKGGKVWLALGSPGGPTIINTVLQVLLNAIEFKMQIQQAVDAPRVHHQWLPDTIAYEPFGLSVDTLQALQSRGYQFVDRARYMGDCQAVMIESRTGMRLGAADSRAGGRAVGY